MVAGTKRAREETSAPKAKKTKVDHKPSKSQAEKPAQPTSSLLTEEVDFPRGGGTSFTPLEVKTIRAEVAKEANDLFQVSSISIFTESMLIFRCRITRRSTRKETGGSQSLRRRTRRKQRRRALASSVGLSISITRCVADLSQYISVPHANVQRITVGMKILGQVMSIEPLALIVSLPNQLLAHIPITNISSQLTQALETMDDDHSSIHSEEDDEEEDGKAGVPDLLENFRPGQYVRAVVSAVHAQGSTDFAGFSRSRDETHKASRRVELSLLPAKVNEGVVKSDLKQEFVRTQVVNLQSLLNVDKGMLSFRRERGGPRLYPRHWIGRRLGLLVVQRGQSWPLVTEEIGSWLPAGCLCSQDVGQWPYL